MTMIALGHVMDITEKRPAAFVTTAEDAAAILDADGCPQTAASIRRMLAHIRADCPPLVPYLTHPSIILGIARGRCTASTMLRWLEELEYGDDCEDVIASTDDAEP